VQLPRVTTEIAMTHVVKRVEPMLPANLVASGVGGTVIADVIVRANGTVELVTVLAGPEPLRGPCVDALSKWTFRPFVQGGNPARVVTLIELKFRDRKQEEEQQVADAYEQAMDDCRLQAPRPPAIEACREASRRADRLSPDRKLERSHPLEFLGVTFLTSGRPQEAIEPLERAAEFRKRPGSSYDPDLGATLAALARAYRAVHSVTKADETYTRAEDEIERAIPHEPGDIAAHYRATLRTVLIEHAAAKREMGDETAARALEQRASRIGG